MNRMTYRWWVLMAATITQMCAALSTQGIGVFSGFLKYDFNLSNSKMGLLASILNIAPIFGLLIISRVLDSVGERLPVFLGMVTIGFSMLFMSFANHYWMLLIALLFCGVGYSPIQPGGSKAIYAWFTPNQRGFAMGVRQAALPLGGALAAIVFPYIIYYSNWRHAIVFASIMVIIGGLFFYLVYRNPPSTIITKEKLSYRTIVELLQQGRVLNVARVGVVLVSIQTAILIFWMLFIHQKFNLPLIKCARYLFAIQISGAIGRVVLSVIGNRIVDGYRRVILIAIWGLVVLLIIIAYLPGHSAAWFVMLLSCLLGFLGFGWYGPWIVWLSEEAPAKNIGAVLSGSMALNQIAIVLAPLLFGCILDASGSYLVPWLCLAVIAGFPLLFWNKNYDNN